MGWLDKYQTGGEFNKRKTLTGQFIKDDQGKPIYDNKGNLVYGPQSGMTELTPLDEDPIFGTISMGAGLIKGGLSGLSSVPKNLNFAKGKGIWLPKTPRPTKEKVLRDAALDVVKLANPFFKDGGIVNPNNEKISFPPNFEGQGILTKGFNYNSAWGGRWENGGKLPVAQFGMSFTPAKVILKGMMDVAEAPQKGVTQAITGKYQTPSEAMGIENPIGAIATDMVLDPVNLIGAGVVNKLIKSSEVSTNAIKNISKTLAKEAKNIPKKINPKHLSAAKSALKEANEWSRNWYNHPEFEKRLLDIDNMAKQESLERFKRDIPYMKEHLMDLGHPEDRADRAIQRHIDEIINDKSMSSSTVRMLERVDKQNYISKFETRKNKLSNLIKGRPSNFNRAWGISGYDLDTFSPTYNEFTRQNLVDKDLAPFIIKTTGVHEGAHGINDAGMTLSPKFEEILQSPFDMSKYSLRGYDGQYANIESYILDPTELYSRVQELRMAAELKPGQQVTTQMADHLIDIGKNQNLIHPEFFKLINDKIKFRDMLNTVPAIAAPLGVAGVMSQKEPSKEFKEGGVVKDNRGYWNPNNWGKPVEIDSNVITMKGVHQNLLGISDKGDVKLMRPGENHVFKGKKVREYPVAKNGKELTKLDQLTNFTNYNTKQPGGWLDKY